MYNNYFNLFLQYTSTTFKDFIPDLNKNELVKQLNEDIQNKVNEIKRLKNEVEKYKKESELYKKEMEKYKIENEKLNSELLKLKKIIGGEDSKIIKLIIGN